MEQDALKQKFDAAYEEWADAIFRFLLVRLGDRERARELTQETFMKAWTHAAAGNRVQNMRPFLYTIASNLFKNELRDRKTVYSLDALMDESHFEPEDTASTVEVRADSAALLRLLDTLEPPEYKAVLTMRYIDGLPVKEIATILKERSLTTSVRLHRALKKLRRQYEGTRT